MDTYQVIDHDGNEVLSTYDYMEVVIYVKLHGFGEVLRNGRPFIVHEG